MGMKRERLRQLFKCSPRRISALRRDIVLPHILGRPVAVHDDIKIFAETNWLANARISDEEMARMVNQRFQTAFVRTTMCRLRNELRIIWRPPLTIQLLTDEQRAGSFLWCTRIRLWLDERQRIIIFSDESRFCEGPDSMWVRFRIGEWNDTALRCAAKFPKGVMVWGAIGPGFKSRLILCPDGVNALEYLRIVFDSGMIEECDARFGRRNWTFQQDGAPAHTTEGTVHALAERMELMPRWPANRCDLNPIEMLWAIMGARMAGRSFADRHALFAALCEIWDALAMETINSLVADFSRRVDLVIQVRGASISQLLSSHIKEPRPQDVWDGEIVPFTAEEDAHIMSWVGTNGRKWARLLEEGPWAGTRTRLSLKHRYDMLDDIERNDLMVRLQEVAAGLDGFVDIATDLRPDIGEDRPDEEDEEEPEEVLPGDSSAFMHFCINQRALFSRRHPEADTCELARLMGQQWRQMPRDEREAWRPAALPPPAPSPAKKGRKRM